MNDNKLDIKKNYNNAIAGLTAQIIFTLCNVLLIYFTFSEQILKGQDFIAKIAIPCRHECPFECDIKTLLNIGLLYADIRQ